MEWPKTFRLAICSQTILCFMTGILRMRRPSCRFYSCAYYARPYDSKACVRASNACLYDARLPKEIAEEELDALPEGEIDETYGRCSVFRILFARAILIGKLVADSIFSCGEQVSPHLKSETS